MKNILYTGFFFASLLVIVSCGKEDDHNHDTTEYEYHAHIHSPGTSSKEMGDTLPIEVEFERHAGEAVHHINVSIYRKGDNNKIYSKPTEAHIHHLQGVYTFEDELVLSDVNGFISGTDWILEAKVWGEEEGEGLEVETVEFHIH